MQFGHISGEPVTGTDPEVEALLKQPAEEYLVLFSLEVDIDNLGYNLGGFMRIPILYCFRENTDEEIVALNELSGGVIGRMLNMADKFCQYTVMRRYSDEKCKGPYLMRFDFPVERGVMAALLAGMSNHEINRKIVSNPEAHVKIKVSTQGSVVTQLRENTMPRR